MAYGNYITPSQSGIYIGEFHVDDCYAVEWQYRDNRVPVYNYFQEEVATTSLGKKIVTGSIAINFRYPGYLAYAIDKAKSSASSANQIKALTEQGKSFVDTYLTEMRKGSASDRMKLLLAAAIVGPRALDKMSALAYLSQLGPASAAQGGDASHKFPDVFDVQKPGLDVIPIDIWTHFGEIDQSHVAQQIEGVVFVGESQQIQAGAGASGGLSASGINVLEVYSFWAKSVSQYRMSGKGIVDRDLNVRPPNQ